MDRLMHKCDKKLYYSVKNHNQEEFDSKKKKIRKYIYLGVLLRRKPKSENYASWNTIETIPYGIWKYFGIGNHF
jgi:hypothetical protein